MKALDFHICLSRGGQEFQASAIIPGGITAVCGPSGSGKTTLLRCLAGLEPSMSGHVHLSAQTWTDARHPVAPHRRGIGFCFQESRVLPHLSVNGNLRYVKWAQRFQNPSWLPPIQQEEVVDRLGLKPLLQRKCNNLSGGEARRVALGRAFLSARTLLLLDEPFAGLEQDRCGAVRALIADFCLRSGTPVLLATHQIRDVLDLTKRVLLMEDGRCLGCGPITRVLREPGCAALASPIGLPGILTLPPVASPAMQREPEGACRN